MLKSRYMWCLNISQSITCTDKFKNYSVNRQAHNIFIRFRNNRNMLTQNKNEIKDMQISSLWRRASTSSLLWYLVYVFFYFFNYTAWVYEKVYRLMYTLFNSYRSSTWISFSRMCIVSDRCGLIVHAVHTHSWHRSLLVIVEV